LDGIKFCPYCGNRTIKGFNIKDFIPKDGLVFISKYKNSKKVKDLIQNMKAKPSYSEIGEREIRYCLVSTPSKNPFDIIDLLGQNILIGPGSDNSIYENGKKLNSSSPLINVKYCVYRRNQSNPPGNYCFGNFINQNCFPNLVGCLHVGLDLTPYSSLFTSGFWDDVFGNYIFQKEVLVRRAQREMRNYRFCPFLDEERIIHFIELWPERININIDHRWENWPPESPEINLEEENESSGIRLRISFDKYTQLSHRFPVATDMNFYIDILNRLYPENTPPETREIIKISLENINRLLK